MLPLPTHAPARAELERVLRARAWLEPRWGDAPARFAAALGDGLLATFDTQVPPSTTFAGAFAAARAATASASPAFHEGWARVCAVLTARDLARAADLDARVDIDLARAAATLAHVADAVAGRDAGTAPATAFKLHALDRVIASARRALLEGREAVLCEHPARGFVAACFNQFSHALSLFAAREPPVDAIVRDAVLRADAVARRNGVHAWSRASPAARRALARRAVLEAAGALAGAVPQATAAPAAEVRDAGLWLARTAARLAACAEAVDAWFPDATPASPRATTAASVATDVTEEVMKDTTPTLIKTLQVDATEAAWRAAGSQFVKLTREPLVGLLSRHLGPGDESLRARIGAFLETELGTALLTAILAAGLGAVPASAGDVPQRLARELRVRAMSDVGDVVAEVLMGPLREVIALYLRDVGPAVVASAAPPALGEPAPRASGNVLAMNDREAGDQVSARA